MGKWAMYRRRGSSQVPFVPEPVLLQSSAASCGSEEVVATAFLGLALRLTAPAAFTIEAVELAVRRSAGFAQNTRAQIWLDQGDGNAPFSVLGTSTDLTAAALSTSQAVARYEGLSVPITNGQVYWVIWRAAAVVGVNELWWGGDLTAGRLMNENSSQGFSLASNDRARCLDVFGTLG